MKRDLLTIKEVASLLRVNEMTLRALIKKGKVKVEKIGRLLYLDPEKALPYSLNQKFYTIDELATLVHISHITLRKLIVQEELRSLRIGVLHRIPEQEVLRFTHQKKISPLLDIKDLEKELQKSRLTILKLIASGQIAAFRIGNQYRISQEALNLYLARAKKEVYTVREVAKLLKVHPALIREEIKANKLSAQKVGKQYLVTSGALFAFFESKIQKQ